jgi:hypothetical protein
VSAEFAFPLVNVGGTATWELEIPSDSNLIGHPVYVQGLVFDFGINPINAILTTAGGGVLGGW